MAFAIAMGVIGMVGFRWNARDPIFRVRGFSMAPTFYGDHRTVSCPDCESETKISELRLAAQATPARSIKCWHCGHEIELSRDPNLVNHEPGDLIQVTATSSLAIGDVVAVNIDGRMRVKRILGLPGDRVAVDQRRLLVNGSRLEAILEATNFPSAAPLIDVDVDRRRTESRWSPAADASNWARSKGHWTSRANDGVVDWLVYHHQAVHQHSRPSAIYDDYPCNVDVIRQLDPVDQLAIAVTLASAARVEVAFFTDAGIRVAIQTLAANESRTIRIVDAAGLVPLDAIAPAVLTAQTPIAIRVHDIPARTGDVVEGIQLRALIVQRSVEYRLRQRDSGANYPRQLGANECFVVGDNVPISVDSREFGPVPIDDIVGVVSRASPDTHPWIYRD
ncbi:S26 family signal peptidase [Novipirellula galeiformis]|nr:S26 family signal peptidase [Novipirellula galeiformis]